VIDLLMHVVQTNAKFRKISVSKYQKFIINQPLKIPIPKKYRYKFGKTCV
jgi:hypothetical protein